MTTAADTGKPGSFKLLGVWKVQLFAGLLGAGVAAALVAGAHITGPAFLIPVLMLVVVFGASSAKVEVDDRDVRVVGPLAWGRTIPLHDIAYAEEIDLLSVWRRFWSIQWLTFWPFGRALLIERVRPGLFRNSLVFNVSDSDEFLRLLASQGVSIRSTPVE